MTRSGCGGVRSPRRAAGFHVLQQLALGFGDLLDGSEELDVHRSDVRVDADVGMRESRQLRDLALVIHPHLADDDFRVIGRVVDAERAADQVRQAFVAYQAALPEPK